MIVQNGKSVMAFLDMRDSLFVVLNSFIIFFFFCAWTNSDEGNCMLWSGINFLALRYRPKKLCKMHCMMVEVSVFRMYLHKVHIHPSSPLS